MIEEPDSIPVSIAEPEPILESTPEPKSKEGLKAFMLPSEEAEMIVWLLLMRMRSLIQSECPSIFKSGVVGFS